ncbi:S1 family peptidase [Roseateles oligotrophus]|uniref:Serine protease n=1 Tax=Roseateles oligotrophus TaxID=1769250 RepID=A0ABT2YF86_9BURK|nr:serine protease [Roseateles oligotrophus]MCV2368715.1 serine protease [Roseateles oligotrophus]
MRKHRGLEFLGFVVFGCLLALITAQVRAANFENIPELIRRVKPSVVLVGTYGELDSPRFTFRGTGFAVADGRRIVTNAHVIPDTDSSGARVLVIRIKGESGDWVSRKVEHVSLDRPSDLAVMDIAGAPLNPLPLKAVVVPEGTAVVFMGFPIAGALGFSHVAHRAMVSALTPVALPAPTGSSLNARNISQIRSGTFNIMQLDGTAYPGNSGGPVFDIETGEVVGVINMVLLKGTKESVLSHPSGISYAIPAAAVIRLLGP